MMLDDLEEEKTLGDKIIRGVVAVFLFILVGMLVITLLPGDAEKSLFNLLTGQDSYSAGKIGDENIPIDYFNSARKDCFNRYKAYNPDMASNAQEITDCAYENVKYLKIYKVIGASVGFSVSEQKIKEEIYEQAKQIHSESTVGAGYSEDEKVSLAEIYKNILKSTPMLYRQDYSVASGLNTFLFSKMKETESEKKIRTESKSAKISFAYVIYTKTDLLSKIEGNITIPENLIKEDYDKSIADGSIPKTPEGKIPTLEERKTIIEKKLISQEKQKLVAELESKIQAVKSSKGTLKEISELSGVKIQEITSLSLADLSKDNDPSRRFVKGKAFLKDLGEIPFGTGAIGGPYPDGESTTIFVDFKELKFDNQNLVPDDQQEMRYESLSYVFLSEINQSLRGIYPVLQKYEK
ncbi:MAG: hypothetical protein H7A24_02055 [Leptospiraceae bacterium]|nr:hypothetical protein [Leptospiraceae bacterium]MCP5510633.1 hypothetical protein [Leptospiraceae bacterium]